MLDQFIDFTGLNSPSASKDQNDEEVQLFILAAFGNQKYTKTYKTNTLSVTFSLITKQESDEIEKTLENAVLNKQIQSRAHEQRERILLRLQAAVESISINNVLIYQKSNAEPDKLKKVLATEAAYHIIRTMYKWFEHHCNNLIKEVTNENFFTNMSGGIGS